MQTPTPQSQGTGQPQQPHNASTNAPRGIQTPAGTQIPHMISRQLSLEDYVQREMERDRFLVPNAGNNPYVSNVHAVTVLSKPYMYLHREAVHTVKQKLDARYTMSAPEYIDASLALLADHRAYDPRDFQDMIFHLRKVSRDSLERPWHAVHRWSQFIWDAIEAGDMSWADCDLIQEERLRLCLTAPPSQSMSYYSASGPTKKADMHESLCRAYNSRNGCHHRQSHAEGNTLLLHNCSYCDSVGKACTHPVRDCERRVTHARLLDNNSHNGRRQFYSSNNQYGANQHNNSHHMNGPQQFYPQQNKGHYTHNVQKKRLLGAPLDSRSGANKYVTPRHATQTVHIRQLCAIM